MPIQLGGLDYVPIAGYLALVLWIGARGARRQQHGSSEDFLLLGRQLTLPLFIGSLVATWYGGLLGIGEIAYRDGLVTWITQGGFWYLSYLLFAFWLAERLSRSKQVTLPDQIGLMHGSSARRIALVLNFLNVVPIAYLLSLGLLLHLVTGWPLQVAIIAGAAFAALYSLLGGFRAVVHTDLLQFGLMCVSVALLMIFSVTELGDSSYLTANLPPRHLHPTGGVSKQELVVWAIIALSTLVDPNFYHRCFAADSPRTAKIGILYAIGFWCLFDVCSTFTGLYARAAMPDIDPRLAYPLLAGQLLPAGLKGLFFAGLIATVMSTIDSYCFVGAMTLSHDLFRRTLRTDATDAQVITATRWGVLATAGLAAGLALVFSGSIKAIWKTLGSLSSAAVLVPMLFGLAGWAPPGAATASLVAGSVGTLGWAALRHFHGGSTLKIEAMLPGLGLSLSAYIIRGLTAGGSTRQVDEQ